jgi:hypothetical protein
MVPPFSHHSLPFPTVDHNTHYIQQRGLARYWVLDQSACALLSLVNSNTR